MHDMSVIDRCTQAPNKKAVVQSSDIKSKENERKKGITSSIPHPYREYTHLINLPLQIHNPIFLHPRNTTPMGFLTIPYPLF